MGNVGKYSLHGASGKYHMCKKYINVCIYIYTVYIYIYICVCICINIVLYVYIGSFRYAIVNMYLCLHL